MKYTPTSSMNWLEKKLDEFVQHPFYWIIAVVVILYIVFKILVSQ